MLWESWKPKQNRGAETREEDEVRSRARGSVETAAQAREKMVEKSKGALYREMGKQVLVERQCDGKSSWEVQKQKKVEVQKNKRSQGWVSGVGCRLGPTVMGQERRLESAGKEGLGDFSGAGPVSNKAHKGGPEEVKDRAFIFSGSSTYEVQSRSNRTERKRSKEVSN